MWPSCHLWNKGFCRRNLHPCPVLALVPLVCVRQIISRTIRCSLSLRFAEESLNPTSVLLWTCHCSACPRRRSSLYQANLSGCQNSTENLQDDPRGVLQRGGGCRWIANPSLFLLYVLDPLASSVLSLNPERGSHFSSGPGTCGVSAAEVCLVWGDSFFGFVLFWFLFLFWYQTIP